jgi:hypothetical protein
MSKRIYICKWISFTISTFVIVEKIPTANTWRNISGKM